DSMFKNSFQLLDGIYRLEQSVFQDLYEVAKVEMENRFNKFQDSIKFESIFDIVKSKTNEWNKAGENFIRLRKEKRTQIPFKDIKTRIQSNKTLQTFFSHLSFGSTSTSQIDINTLFRIYANEILLYMAYHQMGSEYAFSLAPQKEVNNFIQMHHRYKDSFNLSPLDDSFYSLSKNISFLLIKCSKDCNLSRIDLQLLVACNEQPEDYVYPDLSANETSLKTNIQKPIEVKQKTIQYNIVAEIPIFLTGKETQVKILILVPITDVRININNEQVFKMEWREFAVHQRDHNINDYLNVKYFQVQKDFYVAKLTLDTKSTNDMLSSSEIDRNLKNLEEQFINQLNEKSDDEAWKRLIANNTMQKFNSNMNQIVQLSRCLRLTSNDLSNSTNIYNLFNKLPKPEI
ncbi:unnamed protein product, partial [Rotaria sp. Silwood2]